MTCSFFAVLFQSTRPSRGATIPPKRGKREKAISIHAPLAGRDPACRGSRVRPGHFNPRAPRGARPTGPRFHRRSRLNFNPRAPRGARQFVFIRTGDTLEFQSTRPSRGATQPDGWPPDTPAISIHAPLAGRDTRRGSSPAAVTYFNPRAPRGARLTLPMSSARSTVFQSTRPSRGATNAVDKFFDKVIISIHAPLAGRDA